MYTHKDLDKFKYLEKDDFMLDTLTGVLNRKNIIDYAKKLIDNNIPFSLGLIDIDDFKTINDNYGHQAGDIALIELSNGFIDYFKDNGLIGRYGGDEFIFIVEGDNDYKTIYDLTYNLYDNILRKMYTLGHITTFITATIGISRFPLNGNNYDELFLKCDKALYRGKMKGRNCFIIYLPEKHDNIDLGNRFKPLLSNQMKSISKTIRNIQ